MTAQETSVHSTSKHRWLIVFGLSVGLVPNSQPHTFSSVSPYGILKRCCRNCKIGVQSDAISSNHFPTAIHCNWCFLSPTIVSLPFLSPSFSPLLPFPIRLTLLHLHPTILFSQTHIQHWYTDLSRVMSAKTLADNTCLKCRKPVSHPCLSLLWTLCLSTESLYLLQPLPTTSSSWNVNHSQSSLATTVQAILRWHPKKSNFVLL